MKPVTHAMTMNGRIHGELKDPDLTAEESIKKLLALLDGTTRYSLNLWRLPDGVPFDRVDLKVWPQEYVQVAGSSARMTLEVRRFEGGTARQYVVGHSTATTISAADEVIPWNGYEARVRANEVFDAAEAADLFIAYYLTGGIPEGHSLRLLDLG
jgi:hypothetical protein